MNSNYFLYYFFDNPLIRWARVIVFLIVGVVVYINIDNPSFVLGLLPLYFVLILQEFFIHFKLENAQPPKSIHDEMRHRIDAFDYRMRALLERSGRTTRAIKHVLGDHEVKYLLRLLDIKDFDVKEKVDEEDLIRKAFLLVTQVNGKYVHPVDVVAAYLILQDKSSRNLFDKGILEQDVVNSLSWVRRKHKIDFKKHNGLIFSGSGVFDFFIYGWSAELSRYASNLTQEVLASRHPEPIGYNREYELLVTALSKNSSSNALLVGEPGIGKSNLVAKLIEDSNMGVLPRRVSNKIVFRFYPERLLAGIENQGDLETRLVNLLGELMHSGNSIVLIPNIENIFGGGGLEMDLSGVIVEYLKSNKIKVIGTTTNSAYKEFIYTKQEARELFDVVEFEEADQDTIIFMLLENAYLLESQNRVEITYKAVLSALDLSDTYLSDGTALPGRAVKLLEDCISNATINGEKKITQQTIEKFIEEKAKIVLSQPSEEESQKLLNLEAEMHKTVVSQDDAVKAIADAMRRVRSGMVDHDRPIASFLFLGPTGVGKTETAKALAKNYFGDEKRMIRFDMTEYQGEDALDRFLSGGSEKTLVDMVLNNPFSEILLDEFEKASPSIHDVFLQILDEGRLTDKNNRTASFKNTIIIATSNAGSEYIREVYKNGLPSTDFRQNLVEKLLQAGIFKPELVNRFDEIIAFKPLDQEETAKVARLFLEDVVKEAESRQINLTFDDEVCSFIAANSYSVEFGARNIKRFIQQTVENKLSQLILSKEANTGSSLVIKIKDNSLVIE